MTKIMSWTHDSKMFVYSILVPYHDQKVVIFTRRNIFSETFWIDDKSYFPIIFLLLCYLKDSTTILIKSLLIMTLLTTLINATLHKCFLFIVLSQVIFK